MKNNKNENGVIVMNIFFSYGHDHNKEIVMKLKDDLIHKGHKVWVDQYQIKGGDDWRREITKGIMESEMMMSFASEYSIRIPGVCLDELMIAVSVKGARVQSVLLEGNITPPANIGYRQYIDMSDWKKKKEEADYEQWYQSKLQEIIDLVESDEVINYAKEMDYIKAKLKPNLNSIKKDRLQHEHYCGRTWLSNKVKAWMKEEHPSKILLIDGAPGVGKSAFMAHEFMFNENVGAILFCEWDQSGFNSLDAISRNLIFQLASKLSDYRYRLIQCLEKYYDEEEINQNIFRTLFMQPLKELIDGNRATITILIDGIDEVMDGLNDRGRRKNAFSELLQKEMEHFPRWLRFVITSRRDTTVLKPLEKADIIHIEEDSKENMEDVKQYLMHELKNKYDQNQIQFINQKCAGNFLYAKMICKALKDKTMDFENFKELEAGDLNYIYRSFFDRTFVDYDEYENQYYWPLALLCASEEAIPIELFQKSLQINHRQTQKYLKILSPYLSTNHMQLRLYHKSMRDWLLSDESDDYQIEMMDGIKMIKEGCYRSYKEDRNRMSDYEKQYLIPYLKQCNDPRIDELFNDFAYAQLLMKQVDIEMQRYQYELALEYAKMTQMICDYLKDQQLPVNQYSDFADIYMRLAYLYFRQANYNDCFYCYDEAYKAYQKVKDEIKQINCLVMKANILRDVSRKEEALSCFEEMEKIAIFKDLKQLDFNLYVKVRLNYAWILHDKGEKQKAHAYGKETIKIAYEAKDKIQKRMYAQCHYLMCIQEYGHANYEEAIAYGVEALQILEQLHGSFSVQICSVLNQIGASYEKLKQYDKAIQAYDRSYQIRYQYYGDHNMLTSTSLRNYAKAKLAKNDENTYPEIEAMLHKVFKIRTQLCKDGNALNRLAQSYMDLSDFYMIIHQYEDAMSYIDEAIKHYELANAKTEIGTCYLIKGKIYFQLKEYKQAKMIFEKGLENRLQYYPNNHPYVLQMQTMIDDCIIKLKDE